MTAPSIQKVVDDAGLNRYEFRILATISRRAGRSGTCYETVPNMAQRCRMGERTAQYALRSLVSTGYICVKRTATPNAPAHYALTKKMYLGAELVSLFMPAWLDDAGLSPNAIRLYFNYLRWSWDGEVEANHARAGRACGKGFASRTSLLKLEQELISYGLLNPRERTGRHAVFGITVQQPTVQSVHPVAAPLTPEPSILCTPTVHSVHPDRPFCAPKGSYEGLSKGSTNDNFFKRLLDQDYRGFAQFVEKNSDLEALSRWLKDWGEARIEKIWTYLRENPSPWTEKHGNRLGALYGLFDALEGRFQNGEPHALCMLWVEMDTERLEKKRAQTPRFNQGDIVQVRNLTDRFEVDVVSGIHVSFTDGRQAYAAECRVVGRAPPVAVNPDRLIPALARRRADARERLAQRGIYR